MTKFKAIPHQIDAFYFDGDISMKPPKWFVDAFHKGDVQITIDEKEGSYIVIYGNDQVEKAHKGYWICKHENGKMFTLSDERFKGSFEPIKPKKRFDKTMDIEELINE